MLLNPSLTPLKFAMRSFPNKEDASRPCARELFPSSSSLFSFSCLLSPLRALNPRPPSPPRWLILRERFSSRKERKTSGSRSKRICPWSKGIKLRQEPTAEENSEITLSELSADSQTKSVTASVYLWFGRMLSNVSRLAHSRSKFEVLTPTVVAGVRGTDFAVEVVDTKQTDVGVFDGEVGVAGLDRQKRPMRESEVVLGKGYQSSVFRNRPPAPPVQLRERMLSFTPQFEFLKNKGTDRRRDLPKIMEKRKVVHQETLNKWKAIKTERSNQMRKPETPPPGSRKTEPKQGMEQEAPPKKTM